MRAVPGARGVGAVRQRPPAREPHRHGLDQTLGAVGGEVRHLLEVEEMGDSPATPAIVILLVVLVLIAVVSVELIVAFAFYFGWL